jgi:predicted dehydrogenase
VYSEKPLAMSVAEAQDLVRLAQARALRLASAPCSLLGEAAQALWHAVREGAIGRVRLAYANFDDGMIAPAMRPWSWRNDLGAPWPAKDEFEVGCTLEHAGYALTWLAAMFGPATRVTAFASTQIPDKGIPVDAMAPDFSVGCIEYAQGVVARVTCGVVAPRDKSITVVGDEGTLFVGNLRDDYAPVRWRPARQARRHAALDRRLGWLHRALESRFAWPGTGTLFQRTWRARVGAGGARASRAKPVDFLRGPAEMADAIAKDRPCRLSAELGVHVLELSLALQDPDPGGARHVMKTSFAPIEPLPEHG